MESQDLEVEQRCSFISDRDGSHPSEEFDLNNDSINLETGVDEKNEECLDSRVLFPMEHIDLMQESSAISNGDGDLNESSDDLQDSTVTDPLDIGTGNEDPFQNLTCSVCSKTFCHPGTLRLHMLIHTGAEPYTCTFCSKKFLILTPFKNHLLTHTGEKPYPCEICKVRFSQKQSLQRHLLIHSDSSVYPECRVCKVKFSQQSSLYRHMKTHPGETPFACPRCPEKFVWHTLLKKHIRFTHRENLFKQRTTCSVCSKSLATSTLKQHMLIHTGERPFQCEFCQKTFNSKAICKRHLATHTGLKPFPCLYCEKSFASKKELAEHTRSLHTCLYCGEMFTEKSQLKNHVILAHNVTWKQFCYKWFPRFRREHIKRKARLVTCTVCHKSMSSAARLGRHMKTHESSTCRICKKSFPRPHIMKTHMLAKHAEVLDRIIRNNIANDTLEKFSCKNTVINSHEVVKTVIRNNPLQTKNDLEKVDLTKTNGFERNTGHSKLIQINEVDFTKNTKLSQSNKTVTKPVIIGNALEKVDRSGVLMKTNGFERNTGHSKLIQIDEVDFTKNTTLPQSNKIVTKPVTIGNDLEKVHRSGVLMKTNGFERNTGHSKLIRINEVDVTENTTSTQSNKTVTKPVIIGNDLEKVDRSRALMKTNGFERNTGHSKLIRINEVDFTNNTTLTQSNKTVTKPVIIGNDLEKVECNDALVKTDGFERNNESNVLIKTNITDVESNETVTKQVIINVMNDRNEDEVEYIIDSPVSCEICCNSRVIKHLVIT